jgi:hypothetical protein
MTRFFAPLLITLAVLLAPTAARADFSVGGYVHGGWSPEAGADWGVGGHVGYELFEFLMFGLDVRFNQVPSGIGGSHEAPTFTGVVRLRLPIFMIQPYLQVRGGFGFWYGQVVNSSNLAGILAGDAGVMIDLAAGLKLRFGIDVSTFSGDFNVERVFLVNGVAGVDMNF